MTRVCPGRCVPRANLEEVREPKRQLDSEPLIAPRPTSTEQLGYAPQAKMHRVGMNEEALCRTPGRVVACNQHLERREVVAIVRRVIRTRWTEHLLNERFVR